jgi:Domain of unknown function (DUF4330)
LALTYFGIKLVTAAQDSRFIPSVIIVFTLLFPMAILDSQGRLFGKFSIIDLAAGLVILMVVVGITFGSVAQVGVTTKSIEVDVIVKGLNSSDPDALLKAGNSANVIIRNEPYGQLTIRKIQKLPRTVIVPQPDGSAKVIPNPKPEDRFSNDMILTLTGQAQINDKQEVVLGNKKVKVGTTIELEGENYNFNSSVIAVRK